MTESAKTSEPSAAKTAVPQTDGVATAKTESNTLALSDWELVFSDDFTGYDSSRWDLASHTFGENLARFRPENAVIADGKLRLVLRKEKWQDRNFTGGEIRSKNPSPGNAGLFYTYGRYAVRMKAAKGSGVISSFFTYRYSPWQEIDIEFLGKSPSKIQFNVFFNAGKPGDLNNKGSDEPVLVELGFDATAAFHDYVFEWTDKYIRWYADGKMLHEVSKPERLPDLPQQVMMNIWHPSIMDWSGPIDEAALPTFAEYEYVRLYRKKP
ncbi:MAG: family 16 glycosylhydrolase [Rhizobacter sp.]|nr:family 16 glycosylhydrolase [Chlorobiales bacterium]